MSEQRPTGAASGGRGAADWEAIQAVVDRVTSWQDGAEVGTVAAELRRGAEETGVALAASEIEALAVAIAARHAAVSARQVLT